jgi:hypothetical protein
LPVHDTNARLMPIATAHTAARKTPSKIGPASTTNQKIPSGKLVSRKVAALSRPKDEERTGPTAIGAGTRCYLSRVSGITATLPVII